MNQTETETKDETMKASDLEVGAVFEIPAVRETFVVLGIEPSDFYDRETLVLSVMVKSPRGIERTTRTYYATMRLDGCIIHHNPTAD